MKCQPRGLPVYLFGTALDAGGPQHMSAGGERVGYDDLGAGANIVEMHLAYYIGIGSYGQTAPGDVVHRHAPALQLCARCAIKENWPALLESLAYGIHSGKAPYARWRQQSNTEKRHRSWNMRTGVVTAVGGLSGLL